MDILLHCQDAHLDVLKVSWTRISVHSFVIAQCNPMMMSDTVEYLKSSVPAFQYMPLLATSEQISEYTLVWVTIMIWIILLVIIAIIYIVSTRRIDHKENFQEKVLLDDIDLGDSGAPTLRDHLIEKEPVFFQSQLDIFNSTRSIYEKIIKTVAGLLAAEEKSTDYKPYVESAIQSITEKAGEAPRFCTAKRLDMILDAPISLGKQPSLDVLYECMPSSPGKYLLLLSYASRILKEQLDSSSGVMGNTYTELDMEEPPIYTSNKVTGSVPRKMASDAAYRSKYALEAPPRNVAESFTGSAITASLGTRPTDFDNQLAAWKYAFDTESVNKIRMYIRYCNKIFSKLDTIKSDVESGSIYKKMDLGPATEMAKGLMAKNTDMNNMNIPL